MLKKALKKQVNPVRSHVERLPFHADSFDRVLVVDALHHFCDQREAIKDLLRVLKPSGRLVIEEPDFNHKGVKLLALAEKMSALMTVEYLKERGRHATRKDFEEVLAKVPSVEPEEYDQL